MIPIGVCLFFERVVAPHPGAWIETRGYIMSHAMTIQTECRNPEVVKAACRRLGLAEPSRDSAYFFGVGKVEGTKVRLEGWHHPLIIKDDGQIVYDSDDTYVGPGMVRLHEFTNAYGVEFLKHEYGAANCTESVLADGTIQVEVIEVGAF
jgi:hypothetical protein